MSFTTFFVSRMTFSSPLGEHEHALARRLRIEQPIRLLRLVDLEAMGEQLLERDLAVCDEARAFLLTHRGEGPRGVHGELAAEHVLADVDRRLPALAHEGDAAPRARGL